MFCGPERSGEVVMGSVSMIISCTKCGAHADAKKTTKGNARLPRGWRRHEGVWCTKCWQAAYAIRAVTIPVVGPVSCSWTELRQQLTTAWGEATRMANWCMTQYYTRDLRREPGATKLAPPPTVYLYPEARAHFPSLAPRTVVSIDHAIQGTYRAARFKILWTNESSLPTFRYPYPLPLPDDSFGLRLGGDRELVCDVRLSAASTDRITLRLRGGRNYFRQRAEIQECISGKAIPVEATLYRKRAHPGDHRSGVTKSARVMLKVVAWFARSTPPEHDSARVLTLRTGRECFLVGELQGSNNAWTIKAEQLLDWVHQHKRDVRRFQFSDDGLDRGDSNVRSRRREALEEKRKKYACRVDSFVKEAAAATIKFAMRARVTCVSYDDGYRGYVDPFPWSNLRSQLQEKCDEAGIIFTRIEEVEHAVELLVANVTTED